MRVVIDERFSDFFEYIMRNRDVFPGFFQPDMEKSYMPKHAMMGEFEFYRREVDESCGAHSSSLTGVVPAG